MHTTGERSWLPFFAFLSWEGELWEGVLLRLSITSVPPKLVLLKLPSSQYIPKLPILIAVPRIRCHRRTAPISSASLLRLCGLADNTTCGCREDAKAEGRRIEQGLSAKLVQMEAEHKAKANEMARANAEAVSQLCAAVEAAQLQLQAIQLEHGQQLDALSSRCECLLRALRTQKCSLTNYRTTWV
jgi:hypothetical protein